MVTRIVKMTFEKKHLESFMEMFDNKKEYIVAQPGCIDLELLQDINAPNIIFTYSHWENEDALNAYRGTELFAEVWKETKSYFSERAVAWSTHSKYKSHR